MYFPRYVHYFMSCLGRMCQFLGGASPYLGYYEAQLIIKSLFFPENLFGSTTTLHKVNFDHLLTYLIAITNYLLKYCNFLDTDK